MWGAVIGDIVGSRFEFDPQKSKDFEFFHPDCHFTDDTVCTAAIAEIILDDLLPAKSLQSWCLRYPGRGYGNRFHGWIHSPSPQP